MWTRFSIESEKIGMCQFCVEHGDGKKWYLEAANYACDLESDLARRGYIVEFARDFDRNSTRAIRYLTWLKYSPSTVRRYFHDRLTRHLKRNHFGQPVPKEDCAKIFDIATSVVRVPCVCRRFAGRGEHSYCLLMTVRPITELDADPFVRDLATEILGDYGDGPDLSAFELLQKPDAMAMVEACETEGLMHSIWTFGTPFIAAMCNCNLVSGCMAIRLTRQFGCKVMWRGECVATVESERCIGCSDCVSVCPFEAMRLDVSSNKAFADAKSCYGCGVCRSSCAEDAIALDDRSVALGASASW